MDDASADAVLSTFTLCTIPDVDAAMREIVRVLRPGGTLHFLEHGRSEDPEVYRRQVRFEPIQRRIAGGCHLTRDPAELAEAVGLRVEGLAGFRVQGPRILTTMSSGRAVRA
jgi:SAM-dependent methyltransferase